MDVFIGDSVKATQAGRVEGYLVRFGNPEHVDLSGDYFTKATDFGFPSDRELPINLYYNHGFDTKVKNKCVGTATVKMDDIGLWLEGQLDVADKYARAIAQMAIEGKLGLSSGASSHLSARKSISDGVQEIVQWTLAEASLTPSPAEWRNKVKSIEFSSLSFVGGDSDVALDSLREVEAHLRALGCSRAKAKSIAPELWGALRDAEPEAEAVEAEPEVKSVESYEREWLLAQLEVLETV
jgi:phage head maturation protease